MTMIKHIVNAADNQTNCAFGDKNTEHIKLYSIIVVVILRMRDI